MDGMKAIFDNMKSQGMESPPELTNIRIDNASTILDDCFKYVLSTMGKEYIPRQEYREIADWLTDNKGRGLLLYGRCGQGKTLLSRYILPAILFRYCSKVVSYYDITAANSKVDEVLSKHIISLDDVGVEGKNVNYGSTRNTFDEIMDSVEKSGKLIIITTNLNRQELSDKYGERVMDRIISTTKRVLFEGVSLRR